MINDAVSVISGVRDRCRECGSCIRVCPVKAIKIIAGQVEIVEERCIQCGLCLKVCTPEAIAMRSDIEQVSSWLGSRRLVAIVAPEAAGAFPGWSFSKLEATLLPLGFHAVEECVLGEEIVAEECLRYIEEGGPRPLIRSTCRAIVEMVEKFFPELIPNLVPLASPMAVQGRLIKAIYPDDVGTVYIGPCIAKKSEAAALPDRPIDAVLTFGEIKTLISERQNDAALSVAEIEKRPLVSREHSVSSGFPRAILTRQALIDNTITVGWGAADARQAMKTLASSKAELMDLMGCNGCIDGPGMGDLLTLAERKAAAVIGNTNVQRSVLLEQLRPSLPAVELGAVFNDRRASDCHPTDEELTAILTLGGKTTPADELDCGNCGYSTCRQKATAIHNGLADWTMCFPRQKQIFIQSTDQLRTLSATDGLTGLINHRAFLLRLQNEVSRAQRYGSYLSLMMIDVDYFKQINDGYGHLEGDRVLKLVADMLRHNIREIDIAARYGGDEFVVILPNTGKTEAFAAAEKLRRLVETTSFLIGDHLDDRFEHVTLSVGVCMLSAEDIDAQSLLSRADKAMYQAKESGRNKTIIC